MHTTIGEQYVVDENGQATAVILPIESYKRLIEILHVCDDAGENQILSDTLEFKGLVEKGLKDIRTGRVNSWKSVWNEL